MWGRAGAAGVGVGVGVSYINQTDLSSDISGQLPETSMFKLWEGCGNVEH